MTNKEILVQLALGSLSDDMKLKLAMNTNTSIEILKILSKDEDWYVRYWVTRNTNTPTEILEILSEDKNYNVRRGVARMLKR